MDLTVHQDCIDACNDCALACDRCVAACLEEGNVDAMTRCIALDDECAALCRLTAALLARDSEFAPTLARLTAEACEACGAECARHTQDHCILCARACRECAQACREIRI